MLESGYLEVLEASSVYMEVLWKRRMQVVGIAPSFIRSQNFVLATSNPGYLQGSHLSYFEWPTLRIFEVHPFGILKVRTSSIFKEVSTFNIYQGRRPNVGNVENTVGGDIENNNGWNLVNTKGRNNQGFVGQSCQMECYTSFGCQKIAPLSVPSFGCLVIILQCLKLKNHFSDLCTTAK